MQHYANMTQRRIVQHAPAPAIDRARLLAECKALRMATDRLRNRALREAPGSERMGNLGRVSIRPSLDVTREA